MRFRSFVLVTALLGAPVDAQIELQAPTGSRIALLRQDVSADQTREILSKFGACIVKKQPALAHKFLLDSDASNFPKYGQLWSYDCYDEATGPNNITMAMSRGVLLYSVANAMLANVLPRADPNSLRLAVALQAERPDTAKMSAKGRAIAQADLAMIGLGECAVRANASGAKRLLTTKINSDDELAALEAMLPAFDACPKRAKTSGIDRLQMRGTVALNFYRLAYAPKAAQAPNSP